MKIKEYIFWPLLIALSIIFYSFLFSSIGSNKGKNKSTIFEAGKIHVKARCSENHSKIGAGYEGEITIYSDSKDHEYFSTFAMLTNSETIEIDFNDIHKYEPPFSMIFDNINLKTLRSNIFLLKGYSSDDGRSHNNSTCKAVVTKRELLSSRTSIKLRKSLRLE
ncbi:hypothetical protein [Thalassotalea sp. SU-HH00458]|uniref:hypothetical protein n=1 Tax=Thalassotalea sp. SU-HH00458 TaxID=3127657 RepID=UPI0031039AD1